jgi:hypothetical protein
MYKIICTETGTSCIDWAQLSRFYLKTGRVQSPKRCVLKYKQDSVLNKNRTMDIVQKHHIRTNVPSSTAFRSYVLTLLHIF